MPLIRITLRLVAVALSIAVLGAETGRADEGVATTVSDRFSQTSTPLTNDQGTFEAVFTHRFNQAAKDAGGGTLWGLDSGAAIGIGMDYVFIRNFAVQIYRVNSYADYEFALKATLVRPRASFPLALGARGGLNWRTASYAPKQASTFGQLLVSYTIANRVTLAAAPSYVENTQFQKNVFNVPVILQLRITKSIALMGEYVPKKNVVPDSVGQWSVALEKQIFNHRFALWMGNSQASTVDQYIGSDYGGGVTDRNMKIGFNLVRAFDLSAAK